MSERDSTEGLRAEWLALQAHHEQYELAALGIKLLSVALCALPFGARWLWVLMLLLWVQEAVLKTFQARLADRLLRVEQGLSQPSASAIAPMQLHREWSASRPRGLGLLRQYLVSACRPTVVLPYPVLMALSGLLA
ncbi:hypothetical protein [Roseateles sp.]|uniref:hypothetical protein n=1 Tax=Roseateles sp. TaxID=1971397 RepID=UPI003BA72043